MRLILLITVAFFSFLPPCLSARNNKTSIKGFASQFSKDTVEFYYCLEKQFDTRHNIARITVDDQGSFSLSFDCPLTTVIFCETPTYTGYFFAERGRNYSISLPVSGKMDVSSFENPFHSSAFKHIIPLDSLINGLTDLNYAIMHFNSAYDSILNNQIAGFNTIRQTEIMLDSFKYYFKRNLKVTDPDFFSDYINFKIAQSEFVSRLLDISSLYNRYLLNRPLALNNPAFWELYKLLFDRYIRSLSERKNYRKIYYFIRNEHYDSLTTLLKTDPVLQNDTIREFALLDEIYQGFYENDFPLTFSLHFLDIILRNSGSSLIKSVAENLKSSIIKLHPGYYPPPVSLKNTNEMEFEMENLRGKYVYLGFCSLEQLGSIKEIEYLKYLHSKHNKYLQIITVVPRSEKDRINNFVNNNSIGWPVLYSDDERDLIREYKVKGIPLFFLLDKEGKLAASPAPLPSENFEQILFRTMRSKGDI